MIIKLFDKCNYQQGAAFPVVIAIAFIISILMVIVSKNTQLSVKYSGDRRVSVALLNLAEAGKEDALAKLRSGAIAPVNGDTIVIVDSAAMNKGYYHVTCASNGTGDTCFLESYAHLGGKECSIRIGVLVVPCTATDSAYNYGLVAGGDISWAGSGTCNTGSARLHCNGQFSTSGSSDFTCGTLSACVRVAMSGSGNITGNVNTPVISKSGSGTITGTQTIGTVPPVAIPAIDLTPYYNIALANGQVFSGLKKIQGSASTVVPGGVMWVNGDFRYSGSGNFTGAIIATGNVTVSASGNFKTVNSYPAIVSINGNIDMSGSGKVTGLIYTATGSISKSGSGDVTGSLICGGALTKSGSWSALTYLNSAPVKPGCTSTTYTPFSWKEN
jgi:hypothetical protein